MFWCSVLLLCLAPSLGGKFPGVAGLNAVMSNVTITPNPAAIDRFPLVILARFTATVEDDEVSGGSDSYLDAIVELCPPEPYADNCFVYPAGHFNRSAGVYHAQAKIATDFAWWQKPPGDFIKGQYTADFALCDGNCVRLKKPTILAEQKNWTLDVVTGTGTG